MQARQGERGFSDGSLLSVNEQGNVPLHHDFLSFLFAYYAISFVHESSTQYCAILHQSAPPFQIQARQGERALLTGAYYYVRDRNNAQFNAVLRSISKGYRSISKGADMEDSDTECKNHLSREASNIADYHELLHCLWVPSSISKADTECSSKHESYNQCSNSEY